MVVILNGDRLSDTILKGDHARIIAAKFGSVDFKKI